MIRILLISVLTTAHPLYAWSQSVFDREIRVIADDFATAANVSLAGHNIAIGDILDAEGQPVKLGKLLAEELTFALRGQSDRFNIVDRTHFQTLMDEVEMGSSGLLDDKTVLKLGRMIGISAIIYGNIYQQSNHYTIYLKYAILERQTLAPLCRGGLSRVPSVDKLYEQESAAPTLPSRADEPASTNPSRYAPYQIGSLKVEFTGCTPNGSTIECRYTITSIGRNESFMLLSEGTYLQRGNRRSAPALMSVNGQQSTYQLSTTLIANRPVSAVLQFRGFSTTGPATLNLRAKTPSVYEFDYPLNNLPIQ